MVAQIVVKIKEQKGYVKNVSKLNVSIDDSLEIQITS